LKYYVKMDLEEQDVCRYGLNSAGSEYGPVADTCEDGNESLSSIETKFVDKVSKHQL
jgi:hypothetical protein